MEKFKEVYYYFFYKIYKSIKCTSEFFGGSFGTDFKAGLAVLTLELFFWMSLLNYYSLINNTVFDLNITSLTLIIPLTLFCMLNYFLLIHTDNWKKYNMEFDQLPIEKNKKGGIIVWIVIVFVVINLFFSYFLLLMTAKRNHTGPYSKEYIKKQKVKDSLDEAKYKMEH